MFQGFYNLASGMLYQTRNLNVIGNNMVNSATPGYKPDRMVSTTFREEMLYRSGNRDKSNPVQIGSVSMIRASRSTVTSYNQGAVEETGGNLDFALTKPGFFVIQDSAGNQVYTRNGSFTTDEDGYLSLGSRGRVIGEDGNPIELPSDHIMVDQSGNIYEMPIKGQGTGEDDGNTEEQEPVLLGKLRVVDFNDYSQLVKGDNGVFTTTAAGNGVDGGIQWKSLERSNIDPIEEMTQMITSQRATQSAAQVLRIYDQLMGKVASDIGRI
ncbi:flagellar hook-basal body protein [Lacrimispora sp. BS-2]|uniref:Flagellar hook-basal body protein n=1 Tax=Lacrimispora sp. BS-2 TaxID=3151850 RepID=A0AAU7PPL0_9FIRM